MSVELSMRKHEIKDCPHLALLEVDPDEARDASYFAIVEHETSISFKEDQYGPYKTSKVSTVVHFFEDVDKLQELMMGLADSMDRNTDFTVIASGEIPYPLQKV